MSERRALVTGGSGSLGSAICRRLASDGVHVIVHANKNVERANAVSKEIREAGGSSEAAVFDVTDETAAKSVTEDLLKTGPIQIVVNNAGVHDDAPMAGMAPDQWRRVVDVSLTGFFNTTQPLLLPMIRTRWGRIVNISSISGLIGNRGQTNYSAAKAGLHGATKALSLECASRGITVNAVAPGVIETEETSSAFPADRISDLVPMKRAGTPDEVAELVAFLASDRAGYITGQIISISGGIA